MNKPHVSRDTIVAIACTGGAILATSLAGLFIDVLREVCAVLVIHQGVRMMNHVRDAVAEKRGTNKPKHIELD